MTRKFNKHFKKDENGKNREWTSIEEKDIRELWRKTKEEMEEIINEFKYLKIPRTMNGATTDDLTPLGGTRLAKSMSIMYARLLSEEDLNRVKDKFNEDTEFALEEAIRKHVRILAIALT